MLGEETFHPDTRALLAYGRALAGAAAPPPGARAANVSERLFVVDETHAGRLAVRSFGGELIALFGRDLRETDLMTLLPDADRELMRAFVATVMLAGEPGVARALAETEDGRRLGMEMLLTPLAFEGAGRTRRLLGLFQPLGGEAFLAGRPITRLRIGALHPPMARPAPRPRALRLVVCNDA